MPVSSLFPSFQVMGPCFGIETPSVFLSGDQDPILVCVRGFPHTTKPFSDTSWVSYGSTQFWCPLARGRVRFHSFLPQSHRLPSSPDFSGESRLLPVLLTNSKSEVPMTHSFTEKCSCIFLNSNVPSIFVSGIYISWMSNLLGWFSDFPIVSFLLSICIYFCSAFTEISWLYFLSLL